MASPMHSSSSGSYSSKESYISDNDDGDDDVSKGGDCVDVSIETLNDAAIETSLLPGVLGNWSKLRRRTTTTPLASKSVSFSRDEEGTSSETTTNASSSLKDPPPKVFFIRTKPTPGEESRDDNTPKNPRESHSCSSFSVSASASSSFSEPSSTEKKTEEDIDINRQYSRLNTPQAGSGQRVSMKDASSNGNEGQELTHVTPSTSKRLRALILKNRPLEVDLPTSPSTRVSTSQFQAVHCQPPTELHALCEQSQTIADLVQGRSFLLELNRPRKDILGYAGQRDGNGRYPLHLLSDNKFISTDLARLDLAFEEDVPYFAEFESKASFENHDPTRELNLEKFVVGFLLMASPSAAMSRNDDGRIPFEGAIANWVNQCHDDMVNNSRSTIDNKADMGFASASLVVTNALKLAKKTAKRTMSVVSSNNSTRKMDESSNAVFMSPSADVERGGTRRSSMIVETVDDSVPLDQPKTIVRARCFPIHVRLSSHMIFALKMLSKIIDKLDMLTTKSSRRSLKDKLASQNSLQERDSFDKIIEQSFAGAAVYQEIKDTILFNIASIPDLVKTLLLIQNEAEREFALNTTIIRRVLLSKHSMGPWLTAMLQGNKRVSKRAVGYLKQVSDLSAAQKPVSKKTKSGGSDLGHFEWHRDELHNEISRLQDFVPSILSLGEKGVEDAATTMVVRRVMDRIISSPFAVSVIFCDALFLAILIFGFRSAVNNLILRGDMRAVMRGIYIANTGIFYYIIRELGKAISLFMITHRARDYVKSFWNLTDLTATLLALISVITIRSISRSDDGLNIVERHGVRDLLALTTGFLWLRVLSLLKGVNMQMATFILAILQITKDTLTFGIILVVMVITFAQMFFTVLAPSFCSSEGEIDDPDAQCVQAEYYFKVYTVLLGEFGAFERSSFKTWFSLLMLVVYSFMVIIVLLNVLIAVASDSYEKCLMKSQSLFGRARVMLIAELVSFQNLLRKTSGDASTPTVGEQNMSPNSNRYHKFWASQSFARNWSRGSMLFFGLSSVVVLFWAIGEIAGYASGERYGNVLYSVGSILINITVFAAIMLFLSRGSENIASKRGDLVPAESNISDNSGLPPFLQRWMLRMMGSSQDTWNRLREGDQRDDGEVEEWRGRVHHLQSRMDQLMRESAKNSIKQTQALEQLVASTEMRIKSDMTTVDQNVNNLKADLLLEMKQNQESTLSQIQEYMKRLSEDMEEKNNRKKSSSLF